MKFKFATILLLLFVFAGCSNNNSNDNSNNDNTTELVYFNRTATFPVCSQIQGTCNTDTETAAEIVAASADGMTLIYSDSPMEQVGFVDITDTSAPVGGGTFALSGEPTSVAVHGSYALVAVNTSTDYVDVSGELAIIDIDSKALVHIIELDGQPDSIAVSPDGAFAAIIIENERNEDLGNGVLPQAPAGTLNIIDLDGQPTDWVKRTVDMTGIADLFPTDPEPEFVDINAENIAVVTLQENNHIVLVDLTDGSIVNHFSAGSVNLTQVDATEENPAVISQGESINDVPREPDGVSWIDTTYFATADEGDLNGGSRGFTIYNTDGNIIYTSGNSLEHMAARFGHYPDNRSGNKGNEPENIEFGVFGDKSYLFVNSERSSLVFVYDVADPENPVYLQTLPAASGPEGGVAIPSRNLFVVASEKDDRGDKLRSSLNFYSYGSSQPSYPTLESADRSDGTPIPWGAMSGLSSDPLDENILYAIEDSFYQKNRIFKIDISTFPAKLTEEIRISDANDVFSNISTVSLADPEVDDDHSTRINVFDEADLDLLINADKTVNIDPEGVAKAGNGGYWVVSEGSGTVNDENRPVNSLNFLFKIDVQGIIEKVITLPQSLNNNQLRFGFEGVAEYNNNIYVAFQRTWDGDTNPRIGIYDTVSDTWSFFFYPLDTALSQNGGWVGLSDLTSLGNGEFLVLERDNQGGPDAAIKRIYKIDTTGLTQNAMLTKTLVRDLMDDLASPGGLICEKVEGVALMSNNNVWIINDNDGVDDNSGETQLINLGDIVH